MNSNSYERSTEANDSPLNTDSVGAVTLHVNGRSDPRQPTIFRGLNDYSVDPPKNKRHCCEQIPARYALAVWAFFGFVCLYAMRVNLSVAIVAMVRRSISEKKCH